MAKDPSTTPSDHAGEARDFAFRAPIPTAISAGSDGWVYRVWSDGRTDRIDPNKPGSTWQPIGE